MSSYKLVDNFQAEVDARLLELGFRYDSADKHRSIKAAVIQYSRYKPLMRTADITGDGGFEFILNASNFPSYVDEFSWFTMIEYPYDSDSGDPNEIEPKAWRIMASGTDKVIRFLGGIKPSTAETVRFHYAYPREFDDDDTIDVPLSDFPAICDLSTAFCLEALANRLTSSDASGIAADIVDYRSKSGEARANAKAFRARFNEQLGISDGDKTKVKPAGIVQDVDIEDQYGNDYITHPSRLR